MICLGTMNFGTVVGPETAFGIMDRFVDAGGVAFDTANCYASWLGTGDESELVIGEWLRRRKTRGLIRLASKVGARPAPDSGRPDGEGLAAKTIRAAATETLNRLGTDYLDIYYAHMIDTSVRLEESLGALDDLVTSGKTREVGLSNHDLDRVRQSRSITAERGWTPVTWLQQRHSYLRPQEGTSFGPQIALTPETADWAEAQPNLTLQGYSPLLSGAYTRNDREFWPHYRTSSNSSRLVALREVADQLRVSPNQVVIAWMLGSVPSVEPVVGVSSVGQLEEALAATHLVLHEDHWRRLESPC
ncbi:aldo/keto reductase [Amycolatopsis sp. H20-H5]|uniref:aldo/keto reductase n=1 Tax=Amycolatopsis sp. H20-H5 TaxID=3046309 RepID=UPI002DB9D8CC|nr:aldo/keto reductase [Amycolatopsis sp. H20-H5]MEC3975534.1 aldo/keto reductase [Amycolatopsis sp. H20-H5]